MKYILNCLISTKGVNDEFEQPEDYHGELKPIIRRKRSIKKHKNI